MTRQDLVEHFRACDAMLYQLTEEAARRAASSEAAVLADWLGCQACGGEPPAALLALALRVSDHEDEVGAFLRAAHCCACRGHCACGGYVSPADLEAVIACFESASSPPSLGDWWAALWGSQAVHTDHQADPHRLVVCHP